MRALSMAEGQRLHKITRTAKNPVKLRRATSSAEDAAAASRDLAGYFDTLTERKRTEAGVGLLDDLVAGPLRAGELSQEEVSAHHRIDGRALNTRSTLAGEDGEQRER
ncbi:hypothetical protein [Actinoplanes siamensis]|uniref:Uncharacterized protein n=1 Tax=Actinoplanes siamensis TaxID=1223317 RepID=A0A919N6Y8_9ACTN|nr:hypothetical protein [Actinoplanes siamensis]GIF05562.1 hypothetical protein Asi03nite_31000 [Actinoplanes siamensis]